MGSGTKRIAAVPPARSSTVCWAERVVMRFPRASRSVQDPATSKSSGEPSSSAAAHRKPTAMRLLSCGMMYESPRRISKARPVLRIISFSCVLPPSCCHTTHKIKSTSFTLSHKTTTVDRRRKGHKKQRNCCRPQIHTHTRSQSINQKIYVIIKENLPILIHLLTGSFFLLLRSNITEYLG